VSVGLDTSVVIRLLVGEPEEQARRAWEFLAECEANGARAHVSGLVVSEAFFVLQHHYQVPLAVTLEQLAGLLDDPRVSADPVAAEVLRTPGLARAKPGFVDRLIHQQYRGEGRTLITFDKTAARLPGSRLLGR
jgi:predicted nucleic acid-binding protein